MPRRKKKAKKRISAKADNILQLSKRIKHASAMIAQKVRATG